MATTTPNYGWTVPTSSDLVKNGATAIETLGDSVDDSLWNSGFGQAGKNKIINGDFSINQRSFTTSTTSGAFGFDRFYQQNTSGCTVSTQAFTAGAAPIAGYEATNYLRIVTTGQSATSDFARIAQGIENVRTFAGQTVTLSFWAKAASGTPKIAGELRQAFGSGGSPSATVDSPMGAVTISTSWARYSITYALPSISGKTVGTTANTSQLALGLWVSAGSDFNTRASSIGIQNNTFDIWGVQVEYGAKATPFQLAGGGDPQSELAMCQRYYYRSTYQVTARQGAGFIDTTTTAILAIPFPVPMRTRPTALEQSGTASDYTIAVAGSNVVCTSVPTHLSAFTEAGTIVLTASLLVAGQGALFRPANTSAYLGWSAEL